MTPTIDFILRIKTMEGEEGHQLGIVCLSCLNIFKENIQWRKNFSLMLLLKTHTAHHA